MGIGADSALLVISRALWNPKPTTDAKSQRFLAQALGYPGSWHVVRTIEQEATVAAVVPAATTKMDSGATNEENPSSNNNGEGDKEKRLVIVDRIYAGDPSAGVDMYFNHHAAQAVAEKWVEGESNGYENKGGQLLPRKPKYQKGDQVKVQYEEGSWLPATIQKRSERKEGYRYSVHYPQDNTTQAQVIEEDIQLMDDPYQVADDMGFSGWQAKLSGKKWKFISPDGKTFTSKTSAMKHKKQLVKEEAEDDKPKQPELSDGDPPWRIVGHDYLGRRVKKTSQHQKSATRTVTIEQVGSVVGWIADTDVDTNGEPGFVSERTDKPANLFCVVFDDAPSHPYASLLTQSQDLEEYELEMCLLPPDEEPPQKKRKT